MRVCESFIYLEADDIINFCNFKFKSDEIKIKKIEIKKDDILLNGSIKKVFSVDFFVCCSLKMKSKKELNIEIKEIKALKINLFSVVEKIISKQYKGKVLDEYVKISGKEISMDIEKINKKLEKLDLKNIEVINNNIRLEFNNTYEELDYFVNNKLINIK